MLGVVRKNLDQRAAERYYGIGEAELTPAQGWWLAKLRKTWNQDKATVAPWWPANSKEAYNSGLDALAGPYRTGLRPGRVSGPARRSGSRGTRRSVPRPGRCGSPPG
jgi:putative transposase